MYEQSLLSSRMNLVGVLDPLTSVAAGDRQTGWIDMANLFYALAIVMIGVADNAGLIQIDQATSAAGANSTVLKQVAYALTDDNKQFFVNIHNKELTQGKRWIRLRVTVGATNTTLAAVVLGGDLRYGEPARSELASLASITN